MAWGNSSNVSTTNLDSGSDSPALARPDIKAAFDELTAVINGRGSASGVAPLNASTKIDPNYLPDEINSASGNNLTLDPATGKVALEEILNLKPQTVAQLNGRSDIALGDVAFCSNGNAGSPCLAVAVDTDSAGLVLWKQIAIGADISDS